MNPRIARLRELQRLQSGEEMDEFDAIIGELARAEPLDPALLPELFLTFSDATEAHEVMWVLLHHVEDYPAPIYVSALLDALPAMVGHAREWGLLLLRRALNSAPYRKLLHEAYLARTPEQRQQIDGLLQSLEQEDDVAARNVATFRAM